MKKIKSLKHLHKERKRLQLEQLDLEDKLQYSWDEFKESLHPIDLAKDLFNTAINQNKEEGFSIRSIIKNALVFGTSFLIKKFINQLDEKLFASHLSKAEK